MRRIAALATVAILLSSCAQITIQRRVKSPPTLDHYTLNQKILAFGLWNINEPIDLGEMCTHGWETLTTSTTALQGLVHVLTLNLYGPWKTEVVCTGPKSGF